MGPHDRCWLFLGVLALTACADGLSGVGKDDVETDTDPVTDTDPDPDTDPVDSSATDNGAHDTANKFVQYFEEIIKRTIETFCP